MKLVNLFNLAEAAKTKIENVISKFDDMVKDLEEGVKILVSEIEKNTQAITKLNVENDSHTAAIKKATTLKTSIENLFKEKE